MDRNDLRIIAEQLESYTRKQGGKLVVDEHEAAIEPTRFQTLDPQAPETKTLFIDGGQATLLESPTFLLQFVRAAVVAYEGRERMGIKRKEWHTLTCLTEKEGRRVYTTSVYEQGNIRELPDIDQEDPALRSGVHLVTPGQVGLVARKLLELEIMREEGEQAETGTLLVRDGDLVTRAPCEIPYLQHVYNLVGRGIRIAGLSKTTHAFTTSGSAATSALLRAGLRQPWHYPHHVQGLVDVGFVKLHEKSAYAFRIDTIKDARAIACILALHATDPVFIGYPYGLVQADEFGRVTHKEQEGLLLTFMHAAQEKYPLLAQEMRSLDAHGILDRVKV